MELNYGGMAGSGRHGRLVVFRTVWGLSLGRARGWFCGVVVLGWGISRRLASAGFVGTNVFLSSTLCILSSFPLSFIFNLYLHIISRDPTPLSIKMAPGAIAEMPNIAEPFNNHRDGTALEATSDAIDDVNVLKAALKVKNGTATQHEKDIYESSTFDAAKDKTQFRQYEDACDRVKNFYSEQHTKQTVAYNLKARNAFHSKTRAEMTIWEAMEKLNTLIDESDPDTSLSQIEHLLQSAEAIRRDIVQGRMKPGDRLPTRSELIAHGRKIPDIARELGADYMIYQEVADMKSAILEGSDITDLEMSCFTGDYVTGTVTDEYLAWVEANQLS